MTDDYPEPAAGSSAPEPQAPPEPSQTPPPPPPPPGPYDGLNGTGPGIPEAFQGTAYGASQGVPPHDAPQPQGAPSRQAAAAQGPQQPFPGPAQPPFQSAPPSYEVQGYPQGAPPGPAQGVPQGYAPQGYAPQGYAAPGYPQGPYPPQPGYMAAPLQKKRHVWPWVLAACVLVALLGVGIGAAVVTWINSTSVVAPDNDTRPYDDYPYNDDSPYTYDFGDGLGDIPDEAAVPTYTLDDLKGLAAGTQSKVTDGRCTTGVYQVGKGKDIPAGFYYLEGSQTTEGEFYLYRQDASGGTYSLYAPIVYFGSYFADLQEGDVIVFLAPESAHMYQLPLGTPFDPTLQPPYLSGCYRVGVDIPAGTYRVAYQESAADEASGEPGAFIMKDMDWNDDSMLEAYYVMRGGSHTITVQDGQFLELYAAEMTPADAGAASPPAV